MKWLGFSIFFVGWCIVLVQVPTPLLSWTSVALAAGALLIFVGQVIFMRGMNR